MKTIFSNQIHVQRAIKKAILTLGLLVTPLIAHGQSSPLAITYTKQLQTVTSGGTVTFSGTVQNVSANTVFINGDDFNNLSPVLSYDNSIFSPPASLSPAQSFSGNFFTITVAAGTGPGTYTGDFLILGGADSNAQSEQGRQTFSVVVPAPEPTQMLLFGIGAGALVVNMLRVRRNQPVA